MIVEKMSEGPKFRRTDIHTILPNQKNPYITIFQRLDSEPEIELSFFDSDISRTSDQARLLGGALAKAVRIAEHWKTLSFPEKMTDLYSSKEGE